MNSEYSIRTVAVEGPASSQAAGQLNLRGSLDMQSIAEFTSALDALIENGKSRIVIDFGVVDFIASPVVGTLMSARRRLRKLGGDLALASLSEPLAEKLSLMGVDRVFRFYPTPKSAFEDFNDRDNAETVTMQLPSRPEFVTALRHTISALLKQKGYEPKTVFRIETIAD
jgi:anti-sigma B factor antagonist